MAKLTDEAKAQNEEAAKKQKHEQKIADWESPEELRKDGSDVHPTQVVTPSQPDPKNDDSLRNTRYDGNGGKGE